jgi:hypothetical protein
LADGLPPLEVPQPTVPDDPVDLSDEAKVANFPFPRWHGERSTLADKEAMAIDEDRMNPVLMAWLVVESRHAAAAQGGMA